MNGKTVALAAAISMTLTAALALVMQDRFDAERERQEARFAIRRAEDHLHVRWQLRAVHERLDALEALLGAELARLQARDIQPLREDVDGVRLAVGDLDNAHEATRKRVATVERGLGEEARQREEAVARLDRSDAGLRDATSQALSDSQAARRAAASAQREAGSAQREALSARREAQDAARVAGEATEQSAAARRFADAARRTAEALGQSAPTKEELTALARQVVEQQAPEWTDAYELLLGQKLGEMEARLQEAFAEKLREVQYFQPTLRPASL